jgi:hypothetical protein
MESAASKKHWKITLGIVSLLASACTAHPSGGGSTATAVSVNTSSIVNTNTSTSTNTNTSTSTSTGFVMAPHSPMPTVLDQRGRILNNPKVITLTYSSDSFSSSLQQFVFHYIGSATWNSQVSEYGIGPGTAPTAYVFGNSAPAKIDDTGVQSWLSSLLNSGTHPIGIADPEIIYMIFYPSGTTVTDGSLNSCQDFAGYHNEYVDAGTGVKISYAVVPRCSGDTLADATVTASHELVETVTDPDNDVLGYYGVGSDYTIWTTLSLGSEVGDMCQLYASSVVTPGALGYSIQRTWSNANALAGLDPCGPMNSGEVYYNASPVLPDTVTYTDPSDNSTQVSKGISIPVGSSKTIELDLYSSAPTSAPWTVSAFEVNNGTDLSFSFNKTTGQNGDKILLTITVKSKNTSYNGEPFWIKSSLNGVNNYWPVIVGN